MDPVYFKTAVFTINSLGQVAGPNSYRENGLVALCKTNGKKVHQNLQLKSLLCDFEHFIAFEVPLLHTQCDYQTISMSTP
jgi:hypothetical protein